MKVTTKEIEEVLEAGIDKIQQLEADNDRLTAEVEKVERNAEYHADKNDELVAEVERLRKDLALLVPVCSASSGGSVDGVMCPKCNGNGFIPEKH